MTALHLHFDRSQHAYRKCAIRRAAKSAAGLTVYFQTAAGLTAVSSGNQAEGRGNQCVCVCVCGAVRAVPSGISSYFITVTLYTLLK